MKYIKRDIEGILIVNKQETIIKSSLLKHINRLCMKSGSTYNGRIASLKYVMNRKGLVPLYVNNQELYIFSKNIREWDVVLVNYHRILSYRKYCYNQVLVVFDDLTEIRLDVTFNRFRIQYDIAQFIISVFL